MVNRWNDCTFASFQALKDASNGNAKMFVWPDEGQFSKNDVFSFNDQHKDFEPLMIDKISADMMIALHDSLNTENQLKFEEWVGKCRGHFAALWEMTEERVTITGFKGR